MISKEVPTKEKLKLIISSSVLLALLTNAFIFPHEKPPVEPPESPLTTPEVGPRLAR
jgi:hypothetical protein